jgi:hypothetical protein
MLFDPLSGLEKFAEALEDSENCIKVNQKWGKVFFFHLTLPCSGILPQGDFSDWSQALW